MSKLRVVEDAGKLTRKAWQILEDDREALELPDLRIQTVQEFLSAAEQHKMSLANKEAILHQAILMLENFYAHFPYKRQRFEDADLIGRLQSVRGQLDQMTDMLFHSFVQLAFAGVHDSHTTYTPPPPYQGAIAFLPFQIRFYVDEKGKRRFVVTRVMSTSKDGQFEHKFFQRGAEIVGNGIQPIEEIIQIAAALQPGANPAAFASRGVASLTVRPLGSVGFAFGPQNKPDPEAGFEYIPVGGGRSRLIRFPWGVGTGFEAGAGIPGSAFSMNESLSTSRNCERLLWDRQRIHHEKRVRVMYGNVPAPSPAKKTTKRAATSDSDLNHISKRPGTFEFQFSNGIAQAGLPDPHDLRNPERPGKKFGYLRIRSFAAGEAGFAAEDLLDEFKRILQLMNRKAPDGLILDIRSNPGGLIPAAEKMLQMLTPKRITPALFHYASRPAILRILKIFRNRNQRNKGARRAGDVTEFKSWINDTRRSVSADGHLISGRQLTVPSEANNTGQVYQGPVALVIDALTYSAADIFAGGFMDHEIGTIIGVDVCTGGGGANVWDHGELMSKIPKLRNLPLKKLPEGANMRLAIRRSSRVGRNAGLAIEDVGVAPDIVHLRTKDDLLFNNRNLLQKACQVLSSSPMCRIQVEKFETAKGAVNVTLRAKNVQSLIFYLDGKRRLSIDSGTGRVQSIRIPNATGAKNPSVLRIEGRGRIDPPSPKQFRAVSTSVALQPEPVAESRALAFIRQRQVFSRRS